MDFLINASKFEILFIHYKHFTGTTTATKTPTTCGIHYCMQHES